MLITGRFAWLPLLVSLPLAFLIANVLWINQYPDYEVDKAHGKKNVVRLGKRKSVVVYGAICAGLPERDRRRFIRAIDLAAAFGNGPIGRRVKTAV